RGKEMGNTSGSAAITEHGNVLSISYAARSPRDGPLWRKAGQRLWRQCKAWGKRLPLVNSSHRLHTGGVQESRAHGDDFAGGWRSLLGTSMQIRAAEAVPRCEAGRGCG